MRIDWSSRAVAELEDISDYIERDRGIDSANEICHKIYDAVQELARFPHQGRPGRVQGTRELVVTRTPYIVIDRPVPQRILVLNIKHGAQRWPTTASRQGKP